MERLIKNKWAEIKSTPLGIVYKILFTCAVIFLGYKLFTWTFVWSVCGMRERTSGELETFLLLCPAESIRRYDEYLFWEECPKSDKDLPPNTELLISACVDPQVRGVPGGEVLFVHEVRTGLTYLLDLRTGEKKLIPDDRMSGGGIFLTSDLVLRYAPAYPHSIPYILDATTGKQYELVDITPWGESGGIKSEYDLYFQSAEKVFLHHDRSEVIALPRGFMTISMIGVYLYMPSQDARTGQTLEMYLDRLGVEYQSIDYSLENVEVPSPTGKYIATGYGIFLAGSDTSLLPDAYNSYPNRWVPGNFISWYYDDSGVVYTQGEYYYYNGLLSSRFRIPRPILKLKLPSAP
jgi:hypothetical protein